MEAARAAAFAGEGALHGHVGFILQDDVRRKVEGAVAAIELAMADAMLDEEVDFGAVDGEVNAAFDAMASRVRELYSERRVGP
ncbi:hypothetical protein [Streptomyces sp. NPDC005096]|uniref:hypothetical protein n=1 Tax=Streptomyces sp. NPDC005096 TaxID=3154559 RepID=UPI0033B1BBF9